MIRIEPILARRLQRVSLACAVLAAAIALLGLAGWFLRLPQLITVIPGLVTMKVNTSIGLLLCATAMILRNRVRRSTPLDYLADAMALLVVVIGVLSLIEWLAGRDFGIDNLLVKDTLTRPDAFPGRMALATTICFILTGTGVFLLDRATRLSQWIVIVGLLIPLLALLVYSYNIQTLYKAYTFHTIALNTAIALLLIAGSHLTARSGRCVHHLLIASTVGGKMTRRLLPAIVIVPLVMGLICEKGMIAGLYEIPFGMAVFALATIVVLAGVSWRNATALDRTDAHRRHLEADRDDLLGREQAARARAEKALLARDQLLAIVSHELRAPLTPALLVATALEHRAQLPLDVQEDLKLIHEQIEIEARLIDNLLDMASLNQGKLVLKQQAIDLHETVRTVVGQMADRVAEQGVTLNMELASQSPRVLGDPQRVTQILSNLLGNAIKFTAAGGQATVRSFDASEQQLGLEITDTGIGIEAEVLERMFSPFEQGDPSTTRQFGGMGIGLAIAKMLIQLHGGTLEARSEGPSKGASFIMKLPRFLESKPVTGPRASGKLAILLVDDNPQILWAMDRLMRPTGHDITPVATAEEALAAAGKQRFDLLVSDIGLPDMSGWELMRELRQIRPIHGIAVSGFVDDEDRAKSLEAGFAMHLAKPIDINQLLAAIDSLIDDMAKGSAVKPASFAG